MKTIQPCKDLQDKLAVEASITPSQQCKTYLTCGLLEVPLIPAEFQGEIWQVPLSFIICCFISEDSTTESDFPLWDLFLFVVYLYLSLYVSVF